MANNTLLASDNFTRANGALGANWTAIFPLAGDVIVSNQAQPSTLSTEAAALWSALAWPNDQCSEVTLGTTFVNEASSFAVIYVRASSVAATNYEIRVGSVGKAQLFKNVAGVQTQVGGDVTGLTIAAGDVFSVQVVGPLINIYQNYNRIFYITDFSIASGSPGFGGFSTTNVAHTAIATWRGYNAIQQDGIWQKQGIVIPLLAADIASSGFGIHDIGQIIYEGSAQILSGTVYKTWFSGGGLNAGNPNSVFYAESLDGVSWTRRGTAVLSGISCEAVVKSGSTYWLYGQTGTLEGTGPIRVYNSADGITWTLQNASALTVGTAGQWDDSNIYAQCPPVFFNGAWNLLYTGAGSPAPGALFKVGLATSPDLITWTKFVSNPILSNAAPGPIVNVNGTFYMWVAAGPSSPQISTGNIHFDPVETVRYQSTNLTTWTNPVRSVHHSQIFEDVNGTTGNCTPCAILDVGGRAYMYLVGSPSDALAPQDYQFELAIAPANIAGVVLFTEDATSQVATDAFARGAGVLGANWTTPVGGVALQIVAGNKVEATTTNAYNAQYYSGAVFGNDQYSEVTIATLASGSYIVPAVRLQAGSNSGYVCQNIGPTGTLNTSTVILKMTSGVTTPIGPTVAITPQVGDVLRLSVVGNVISFFQNGAMVLQVQDVNNTYPTGNPGAAFFAGTLVNAQISAWAGGNANVIPIYGSGPSTTFDAKPVSVTLVNFSGDGLSFASPTLGAQLGEPMPVCFTDPNGNEYSVSGAMVGSELAQGTPVVLCNVFGQAIVAPFAFTSNATTVTVNNTLTGNRMGDPTPVVLTSATGLLYGLTGLTAGVLTENPTPIVLCDANGNELTGTIAV